MKWAEKIGQLYVITLEKRKQRRADIQHMLDYTSVPFRFWRGVERPKPYGAEGLKDTMYALFTHAIENDMEYIGVLEDDCEFLYMPHDLLDRCWEQLPEDFHLWYLGGTLIAPAYRYSENLLKAQAVYSSHSVVYSKKAMEMLLPLLWNPDPFDLILHKEIQKLGKSYFCYPMLTSQRKGESDILNLEDVEKNPVMHKYYDIETKEMDWGLFIKEQYERHTAHL